MATDLSRGAYSGKETKLYYNSATHASPTWVEVKRARNVQTNRGPALSDIEFHGSDVTSSIPGYSAFNGSFEYVRKIGDDDVYDDLVTARDAGDIIEIAHLNGPIDESGPTGWQCPVLLGEFAETANGNDGVVVTIPFRAADAYDGDGEQITYDSIAGSAGGSGG